MTYDRHAFRAMGTEVVILGPEDHLSSTQARAAVEAVFTREEQRFSRFRGDSELTRVNAAAGWWIAVSPRFESLVRLALEQAEATDGLFDPSVLDAVIAAGYDRDFDEVLAGARGALHPARPCGGWREIEVRAGAVRLPRGVGLDLGGIAKGSTADLGAEAALAAGLPWALVSAGGDLRIAGDAPAIEVGIEDPEDPATHVTRLRLSEGGIATSSVLARAWGDWLHHVIDPRTGEPARTQALQATAWAPTCALAEVRATWALLTGPDAAATHPCVVVGTDGAVRISFAEAVAA